MKKVSLILFLVSFGQFSYSFEGAYELKANSSECLSEAFGASDCAGVLPSLKYAKSLDIENNNNSYDATIENQFDSNSNLLGKNEFKDESYTSQDGYEIIKTIEWKYSSSDNLLNYETITKENDGYKPSQVEIVKHTISLEKNNMFIEREINYYRWNSVDDTTSASPFSYEYSRSSLSEKQ